ncbi:MAG: hypothetical protein ACLGP3_04415 [Acidobacteriota bacterium]
MIHLLAILFQPDRSITPYLVYTEDAPIWHQISNSLRLSLYRVLSLLTSVLPGILAFFVSLGVFALIGKLLSAIVRWVLTASHFDARVARAGAGIDWSPSNSPTALAARFTFWVFVLLGLLIGVSAFDTSYATGAVLSFSLLPYVAHGVGAILILIIGTLIARFLSRSVLIGAVNAQLQYARFLALGIKWLVLVLAAAMALEHLDVGVQIVELAFSILFGGIVLTLALAVGLGSRHLVSRSLESHVEKPGAQPVPPAPQPAESIRHF